MHSLKLVAAATLLMPTVGLAQDNNGELRGKAKAWMVGNLDHTIKRVAVHGSHTYLEVQSSADIDEDGVSDEGIVRLQCTGGKLRAAHYHATSPPGSASGQASGKRTHNPVTFIKEWSAATPQLRRVKFSSTGVPRITPKIAKESHGRSAASEWEPITVAETATICGGGEDARLESSHKG